MPFFRLPTAMALAGIVFAGIAATVIAQDAVDPAIANMSPEQLVTARQNAMREDGGILRTLGRGTPAETAAAAEVLIKNFTDLQAMFPEGSIVGDSESLPVIWEEKDAFNAMFQQSADHAAAIKAAAEAGDAAAVAAGAQAIGALCSQCHQKYRA